MLWTRAARWRPRPRDRPRRPVASGLRRQALRRSQRGSKALDDRRRRLNGIDRPHALAGVHRHRLDVAAGAREWEVDRIARYAMRDVAVFARALAGRRATGGLPELVGAVAQHPMWRGPTDVEELGEHGVATFGRKQARLVARMRVALVAGHEPRAHHY